MQNIKVKAHNAFLQGGSRQTQEAKYENAQDNQAAQAPPHATRRPAIFSEAFSTDSGSQGCKTPKLRRAGFSLSVLRQTQEVRCFDLSLRFAQAAVRLVMQGSSVFAGRLSTDSGSWGDLRGQRVAVIIAHRAPQVKAKAILLRVSDRPRTQALKANKHMLYKERR